MTPIKHSIIGLPGSGKTTFLAALWHLLNSNEVPTKFALDRLIGDHTHLNKIVEAWRKCEEVARTSMAAETTVSIHVKEVLSGREAELLFSDISGESFERYLSSRQTSPAYVEGFENAGGVLLFVTADRPTDGLTIVDVAPLAPDQQVNEVPEQQREWEPKLVPTQVNLVELLQFLQRQPFKRKLRRVAVFVSAWDVIQPSTLTPQSWVARELPLLNQFLVSNPDSFEFRIYGVSAQGGDVTSDQRMELADKLPSKRINCIGSDTDLHDLTSPLAWLMPRE